MKRTAATIPLFVDRPGERPGERAADAFDAKIRAFAREVGKRHRGRPADPGALVVALRAYHRMWTLVDRNVAPLDDRTVGAALAEYAFVRTGKRARAA